MATSLSFHALAPPIKAELGTPVSFLVTYLNEKKGNFPFFYSFFSLFSGVATFCRVKSAFSSVEAALPIAAEEGFTGLLGCSRKDEAAASVAEGLEEFSREELLKVDSEGRCIITDHGHFG